MQLKNSRHNRNAATKIVTAFSEKERRIFARVKRIVGERLM